jgi:hypothetical protein
MINKGKNMMDELKPLSRADYKKMFPEMRKSIDKIDIYFIIDNIQFDPDEITNKTGLNPYRVYKKGLEYNINRKNKFISESNSWEIEYTHENVIYSEEAIDGFIEQIINPHKDYFKNILNDANGKIEFVYYYYKTNNMGIVFENKFIKLLAELNLMVDFDLYCLHEDEY